MKRNALIILSLIATAVMIAGCSARTRYERRLAKELASGERHDSIFLGIYLGMPDKEFYTHCWLLNRKGLIRQGPNNLSVLHEIREGMNYPVSSYFYPEFREDKIVKMPVKYIYNGWTPWNEDLSAEALQKQVLRKYRKRYGRPFIPVKHPEHGIAYVKVDGNRRISIFTKDDMYVWAVFSDLHALSGASGLPGQPRAGSDHQTNSTGNSL